MPQPARPCRVIDTKRRGTSEHPAVLIHVDTERRANSERCSAPAPPAATGRGNFRRRVHRRGRPSLIRQERGYLGLSCPAPIGVAAIWRPVPTDAR
jgi:hypothetical protein